MYVHVPFNFALFKMHKNQIKIPFFDEISAVHAILC